MPAINAVLNYIGEAATEDTFHGTSPDSSVSYEPLPFNFQVETQAIPSPETERRTQVIDSSEMVTPSTGTTTTNGGSAFTTSDEGVRHMIAAECVVRRAFVRCKAFGQSARCLCSASQSKVCSNFRKSWAHLTTHGDISCRVCRGMKNVLDFHSQCCDVTDGSCPVPMCTQLKLDVGNYVCAEPRTQTQTHS